MYFCEAQIAIKGDTRSVVNRDRFNPVSYPEIRVIQAVHGDEAVNEVKPFTWVEQNAGEEKRRLGMKYGPIVDRLYPGANPTMTMDPPGMVKVTPDLPWKNPITGMQEKTKAAPVQPSHKG